MLQVEFEASKELLPPDKPKHIGLQLEAILECPNWRGTYNLKQSRNVPIDNEFKFVHYSERFPTSMLGYFCFSDNAKTKKRMEYVETVFTLTACFHTFNEQNLFLRNSRKNDYKCVLIRCESKCSAIQPSTVVTSRAFQFLMHRFRHFGQGNGHSISFCRRPDGTFTSKLYIVQNSNRRR